MDSIFPFIEVDDFESRDKNREIAQAIEWAWDFEEVCFKLDKNNQMYRVYDNEAIKIWVWKILNTDRFKYLIYDFDYGNELSSVVGETGSKDYIRAEISRMIRESIYASLSEYVLEISDINIEIDSDLVGIAFRLVTIYDKEVDMDGIQVFR